MSAIPDDVRELRRVRDELVDMLDETEVGAFEGEPLDAQICRLVKAKDDEIAALRAELMRFNCFLDKADLTLRGIRNDPSCAKAAVAAYFSARAPGEARQAVSLPTRHGHGSPTGSVTEQQPKALARHAARARTRSSGSGARSPGD